MKWSDIAWIVMRKSQIWVKFIQFSLKMNNSPMITTPELARKIIQANHSRHFPFVCIRSPQNSSLSASQSTANWKEHNIWDRFTVPLHVFGSDLFNPFAEPSQSVYCEVWPKPIRFFTSCAFFTNNKKIQELFRYSRQHKSTVCACLVS